MIHFVGYIEPVIVILHERELTWAGRVSWKHHTCMISALSINTTLKQHPLIWSAAVSPYFDNNLCYSSLFSWVMDTRTWCQGCFSPKHPFLVQLMPREWVPEASTYSFLALVAWSFALRLLWSLNKEMLMVSYDSNMFWCWTGAACFKSAILNFNCLHITTLRANMFLAYAISIIYCQWKWSLLMCISFSLFIVVEVMYLWCKIALRHGCCINLERWSSLQ